MSIETTVRNIEEPIASLASPTFNTDAENNFNDLLSKTIPDINTWAVEANALASEINGRAAAAQIGGNFVGVWVASPQTYGINDVVFYSGTVDKYYRNLTGTNTATDPENDATNWLVIEQLPVIGVGDALKFLRVNAGETDYELAEIASSSIPTANTIAEWDSNTAMLGTNAVRAWVKFDGTTGSIIASYNVASIVRTAAGRYTVNFTVALPSANYAAGGCCNFSDIVDFDNAQTQTTGAAYIITGDPSGTPRDNAVSTVFFIGG